MANSAQARKRARQAAQTNKHNASLRSSLRTAVKAVRKAIAGGHYSIRSRATQRVTRVTEVSLKPKSVFRVITR